MSKVLVSESNLYDIADSIRAKLGTQREFTPGQMSEAIDHISGGGGEITVEQLSVTQNDTYTAPTGKAYSPVVVNVPGGGAKNILGGTTVPTSADGTDGDIYIQYTDYETPPTGYSFLEYIQSSGTQKINTGVPARVQLKVEVDCQWLGSGDQTVIGGSSNSNNDAIYLGYNGSMNANYFGYANSWHDTNTGAANQDRHKWEIDLKTGAQKISVDGVQKVSTSNSFTETTSSNNLWIAGRSNSNCPFTGRIYEVKIYDYLDNESLIRRFIPAKRLSDNEVGLYDYVNDVFYTNDGTGSFTAGSVQEGTPIDYVYLKVNGSWIILEDGDWDDVNTSSIPSAIGEEF